MLTRSLAVSLAATLIALPAHAEAPTFDLPEPAPLDRGDGAGPPPTRDEFDWDYRDPLWYTAPRTDSEPGVRVGVGLGLRADDGAAPTFVFDVIMSARVVLTRGFSWWGLCPSSATR